MESTSGGGARRARPSDEYPSPSADRAYRRSSDAATSDISAGDAEWAPLMQLAPRLLSRQQAAAYCNLSPSAFSNWIRSGRLPPALTGTTRWDRKAIDAALDATSGLQTQQESSPLDNWRAKRARRSVRNS